MRVRLARKFEDKTKEKSNYEQKLCQEQKERERGRKDEIIKKKGKKEEKTEAISSKTAWKREKKTMARIQYK